MKKRRIGFLLILLANLLLLADVVVPHHHHENSICFSFLGKHFDNHHKEIPVKNTDSDCTGCVLKHTDIVLNNLEKNHFKQVEATTFDFIYHASEVDIVDPLLIFTSYLINIYRPPIKQSTFLGLQGLRAPPIV